ncbi:ras and EF-hand domain-containing protein-like isoform X2 [Anguilla anguilla]|uniref:ras and EF-hand domain-containing protein-like isoform X2 n=1 Tax=Anguilla anguilla TaxID=7936 RepID=UPI0015AA5B37|nr:ras and EF-hand domain-containing protein-like isoform X2 [Anguilla anguilla]
MDGEISFLEKLEVVTAHQLTELEENLQKQLAHVEKRLQEQHRVCAVIAVMDEKHESEVAELQDTVERLQMNQEAWHTNSRVDVCYLKSQIQEMTLESDELRRSLLRAQGNISVLQTEVERLNGESVNKCMDEKSNLGLECDGEPGMLTECQSYSSRIQVLQEMNKQLHDRNDGLHSALVRTRSGKWRIIPNDADLLWKLKPIRQSTLNYSSLPVECGTSYLDSGLSLTADTDATGSSSSEYDSEDDSQVSTETALHSCVSSDVEASDLRLEGAVSMVPSTCSSVSTTRRRLSAFCCKEADSFVSEPKEGVPIYRLVLAGDSGSGKSSFLLRLSLNDFRTDMQTTLGVDFHTKTMLVDGDRTDLQIWDTAGQERFRSITRSYFRKAQGVLLLYDVTSERSFLSVQDWMDQIQECAEERIPMCLIGNKTDLRAGLPEGSCVSPAHGERLAMVSCPFSNIRMYNALFCETSAKEGTNIVEAVLHLASEPGVLKAETGSLQERSCRRRNNLHVFVIKENKNRKQKKKKNRVLCSCNKKPGRLK